jgi:hypothetical protein
MSHLFDAPKNAAFTIAAKPHARRRPTTSQFTRCKSRTTKKVDGVDVIGFRHEWAVAGTAYGISYSDDRIWWLYGGHIDPVDVVDPHDAVAVLRRRGLLAEAS